MKSLTVNLPGNEYSIIIEKGIINNIGFEMKKIFNGNKIAIITDSNVDKYYGEIVVNSLENEGFNVKKITLEPGEKTKSIENLVGLYDELLDFSITRGDLIITLGGGVIGDLGGFVASTLLRGIPFVQVPTSLLAQIDSSIGGKVAVDLPRGKNLVGSFYHPKKVIIDPNVLETLEDRYLYDGMGEVIKYGCIKDKNLFDLLSGIESKEQLLSEMEPIIYTCCDIKRRVVENDEKDTGERMVLNFGHTIGHAIEKYYKFDKYSHGEAVAIGMYLMTRIGEEQGLTAKGTSQEIKTILKGYNLPYEVNIENMDEIIEAIGVDKKNSGQYLNLIMIKEIGNVFIEKVNKNDVKNIIVI
ncbi:3-dehydroquinate synthase [Clostridium sediminicola]|uniref:3-dehydroquinate synthase n=1 Tax=Clostridium sediminicola TaxID=3114879 RepID=UPI0031F1ECEF